jgi:iron complex outermembrane receptor protein
MGIAGSMLLSSVMADEENSLEQLMSFSLEELADAEVTIAGKTPQKIKDIPAAVYVVSQKDIRRMGATSIPEALRMVPGLQVARIDANKWAVTSRGFNGLFANKLLVMMDGRTVYTPLFSGVHWDIQDTVMEDIERIEVIRGPGATVWGANAVNGVINIITKKAEDTQGTLLSGTIGTERGIATARYGNKLSDDVFYRLYAKYRNQDNGVLEDGSKGTDGWDDARGGFRLDWQVNTDNQLTVQGDFYQGLTGDRANLLTKEAPTFRATVDSTGDVWGANLLTRWTRNLSDGSSHEMQFYYDHSFRDSWLAKNERDILDFDYQYHFFPWSRHNVVVGGGYRFTNFQNHSTNLTETVGLVHPLNRQDHLFNAFIQDDIEVIEDSVWLTLGSKFEHNDYSGFEVQPSARLRWKPAQGQLLWASVSRAVRTPSRIEDDAVLIQDRLVQPGVISVLKGNRNFDSEQLIAYELGYRFQPHETMLLDFTLFYNEYDKLRSFSPQGVTFPSQTAPLAAFILGVENKIKAETYGFEMAFDWQLSEQLTVRASYTYLDMQLHNGPNPADKALAESNERQSPEHQVNLLSSYELMPDLTITMGGHYIDRLPASRVGSHIDIDAGLRWQATKNLNIALFGKNLLHDERFEFQQVLLAPVSTKTEREGYLMLELKF